MMMMKWKMNNQGRLTATWNIVVNPSEGLGPDQIRHCVFRSISEPRTKLFENEYYIPDNLVAIV